MADLSSWLYSTWGFLNDGHPMSVEGFPQVRPCKPAGRAPASLKIVGRRFPDVAPGALLDWPPGINAHDDLAVELDNSGMVLLVQELTIAAAVALLLLTLSYLVLARFAKRPPDPTAPGPAPAPDGGAAAEDGAGETDRLPFYLSVVGLAVTIGGGLLVPATILANHIIYAVLDTPLQYYFSWLHPGLLFRLWDATFWGHCLCVFLAVPFGLFWAQAVGGVASKLLETTALLALVLVLHALAQWLLWSLLPLPPSFLNLKFRETWMLPFSFSLISLAGSVLFLVCGGGAGTRRGGRDPAGGQGPGGGRDPGPGASAGDPPRAVSSPNELQSAPCVCVFVCLLILGQHWARTPPWICSWSVAVIPVARDSVAAAIGVRETSGFSVTPPPKNRNRFLFLTQLVAVAGGVLIFGGGSYCV